MKVKNSKGKSFRYKFSGFLLTVGLILSIAGCSESEEQDQNEVSLRAVLEHQFNAPDEEYFRALDAMVPGAIENPELMNYYENAYKPYFMESRYQSYLNAYAIMFAAYDFDYKITVDSIDVKQDEKRPKDYDFTVNVSYEIKGEDMGKAAITGVGVFHDEGKIAKINYFKDGGLFEKLRASK